MKADLQEVAGVKQAHSLHIWSLTTTRTALSAHLATEPGVDVHTVLDEASKIVKEKYNIAHTTLQVEGYKELMNDCDTCQDKNKKISVCVVM